METIAITEVTKEAIVGVIIEVVVEAIAIIEVTKEAIVGVIIEVVEEIIEMTTDVITEVINGIIFNQNEDIFIKNNSAVKTN
jgi:hypothetical protein